MAAQVKEDSLVFSSLAVSKALSSHSSSKPLATSSSPLAGPSGYCPPRPAQRSGKRSASSSHSGGRRRFKGGKRSAPSSNPSGFRKLVPSPCLTLSGGCLSLHWQAWRDRGVDPWVVAVLREGCRIPFLRPPPLSTDPIPMPLYAPTSIKGAALEEVILAGGMSHTLPPASYSVYGSHPHAFVCPHFHQRGCPRGGHPGVDCQGCCGACSSSLARLLQPPVCGLDDSGVVASGHRPVPAQSLRGHFALSLGDHLVCSYVSPAG